MLCRCQTHKMYISAQDLQCQSLQVLSDLLIGKRVGLSMSEGAYWRKFAGEDSPSDLEAGLQLVHKLFTHNIEPRNDDLKTVME